MRVCFCNEQRVFHLCAHTLSFRFDVVTDPNNSTLLSKRFFFRCSRRRYFRYRVSFNAGYMHNVCVWCSEYWYGLNRPPESEFNNMVAVSTGRLIESELQCEEWEIWHIIDRYEPPYLFNWFRLNTSHVNGQVVCVVWLTLRGPIVDITSEHIEKQTVDNLLMKKIP